MPRGTDGLEGATIEDDRPGAEVHRLTWVDADAFFVHGDGLHVRGGVAADGALFNATLAGDLDGLVTIPGWWLLKARGRLRPFLHSLVDIEDTAGQHEQQRQR
jgi:hypothetical protein